MLPDIHVALCLFPKVGRSRRAFPGEFQPFCLIFFQDDAGREVGSWSKARYSGRQQDSLPFPFLSYLRWSNVEESHWWLILKGLFSGLWILNSIFWGERVCSLKHKVRVLYVCVCMWYFSEANIHPADLLFPKPLSTMISAHQPLLRLDPVCNFSTVDPSSHSHAPTSWPWEV